MDETIDVEALRMFVRVAEQASFTRAGQQLGIPKSRVSLRLKALEERLGTRLLQRTTRAVRLTPSGEQLLERARQFLAEATEMATMFQAPSALRGRVRIDLPVAFSRNLIIPRLPDFLAQHPHLELLVSTSDRRVDIVREGFDCVLRIGTLRQPGLVARRLGVLPMVNVASPAYLRRHGTPRTLSDLAGHLLVNYSPLLSGEPPSFEYRQGSRWVSLPMRGALTVNGTDAYMAAGLAGLGILQVPRIGMQEAILRGQLVEILPEFTCEPMPVSLVHSHGRALPKPVRAVMAFIAEAMTPAFRSA
ncbi:MAG TPA: LysR family transcriptional regulator [Pseudomonadota bacterium]|nr:LysR family transcriptional regulator [Pseudomonadota bacterium]